MGTPSSCATRCIHGYSSSKAAIEQPSRLRFQICAQPCRPRAPKFIVRADSRWPSHRESTRALESVRQVRGTTNAVEPEVLGAAVKAICALKRRDRGAADDVNELIRIAFATGGLDLLVTGYRSSSELLAFLLRAQPERDRIAALIRRASDDDLARSLGHFIGPDDDPRHRLTPREREVYDLICQGLSNQLIGNALFISDKTAKLHAQHIYEKLGVRSRTTLILQAALERGAQATSATGGSEDTSS